MDAAGERLDKQSVRRGFDRTAKHYEAANFLAREIGTRMEERLHLLRAAPTDALDLGSGTGAGTRMLRGRYPDCRVIEVDLSLSMLVQSRANASWWQRGLLKLKQVDPTRVCGDAESLPFKDSSFDMVWSNLVLHWVDIAVALGEIHRVLRPGGVLMFSTLGPDTMKELRASFEQSDRFDHVNRFVDLHDVGDMLVQTRFGDPVMDMEYITLTYASIDAMFKELRAASARNANPGRPAGLTGRGRHQRMRSAYEAQRHEGRIPATFEVVYGHAWRPEFARRTASGDAVVEFHPSRRGRS